MCGLCATHLILISCVAFMRDILSYLFFCDKISMASPRHFWTHDLTVLCALHVRIYIFRPSIASLHFKYVLAHVRDKGLLFQRHSEVRIFFKVIGYLYHCRNYKVRFYFLLHIHIHIHIYIHIHIHKNIQLNKTHIQLLIYDKLNNQ